MQIRNCSPRTIRNYLSSVSRISQHYKITPDKLTRNEIKTYIQARINAGSFSASAVNQLISALKILFVDVVGILSESVNPNAYWRKLKQRLKNEGNETVTNCHALKMQAADGKMT
ncbi:MAG: site-specific integrase [Bacteroidetes bacterium]|nr:site-specific integrase [Bacteroidota bacterium]